MWSQGHMQLGGYTPLHYSARWGHTEVVVLLLQQPSVEINSCDENGETPLHRSAADHKLHSCTMVHSNMQPIAECKCN